MRNRRLILLLAPLILLFGNGNLFAAGENTTVDAGNLTLFVSNNGTIAFDPNFTRGDVTGLYYPKQSYRSLMSGGGIWVAGKVNGNWRITISGAESEFAPGTAYHRGKHVDPFPIYKITRGENLALNDDYLNWPSAFGAPTDLFGQPLINGGQALFALFADTDTSAHVFSDISGTLPLGVEVKCYVYTYDNIYQSLDTSLTQVVFFDYTVTNVSGRDIDSCIVTIYGDPDIGYGFNDRVGCDSTLNAAYCYNESDYDVYYGSKPPATGMCLLENNAASINFYYSFLSTDPRSARLDSLYKTINLVRGRQLLGNRYVDPVSHSGTNYPYNGNPVDGTGWIDSVSHDYKFVLNTAPIRLAAGDSTKVKTALIVAQGMITLESVSRFLQTTRMVRSIYLADSTKPVITFQTTDSGAVPVCSFRNNSLFAQEINIKSPDPLHLVITPAKFTLGMSERKDVTLRYYSSPTDSPRGEVQVYSYSFRNSLQRIPVSTLMAGASLVADVNGNREIDFGDLLQMVNYLYRGGSVSPPEWKLDTNCDGVFDLTDLMAFINVLFHHAEFPCSSPGKN